MIRKNVSKRKNLEVFFCCTMSALPLNHIIVKEMVRVINTWIRLRFFWRKSFKENPAKDFSLPLSPLSSFEFWCKTNFYLFIAVALITITCAANFLQLSKKQTCRYLLFWIRGPIHRPILNKLWSGHCLFCHRCPILSFATVLKSRRGRFRNSCLGFCDFFDGAGSLTSLFHIHQLFFVRGLSLTPFSFAISGDHVDLSKERRQVFAGSLTKSATLSFRITCWSFIIVKFLKLFSKLRHKHLMSWQF